MSMTQSRTRGRQSPAWKLDVQHSALPSSTAVSTPSEDLTDHPVDATFTNYSRGPIIRINGISSRALLEDSMFESLVLAKSDKKFL